MSDKSEIEWTDATWNPVRGCVKVSPGCKHCYAETFAERFRGVAGHPYEQGFDPRLVRERLDDPLRWREPRRIFVNSMSDLFQEAVPMGYITDVFRVMATAGRHTFQVLTKRAERMREWVQRWADVDEPEDNYEPILARGPKTVRAAHKAKRAHLFADMIEGWGSVPAGSAYPTYDWMGGMRWWPSVFGNVHLGVSVEDRKHGVPRIDVLRDTPAAVRFLSIEPLLEDLGTLDLRGIHQVIVGAERAGRRARPMHDDWVRSIRDQCIAAGVAFFYKQQVQGGKMVSLPMLDGERWSEMP